MVNTVVQLELYIELQLALIFVTRLVSVAKFGDGETPIPHIDWGLLIVAPWV